MKKTAPGHPVEFVDLAEVADGLHVAPVHAKHELAFGRHHPHQPRTIGRKRNR